jgi:hypothetical protein
VSIGDLLSRFVGKLDAVRLPGRDTSRGGASARSADNRS